jgi:aminopeptidase N
VIYTDASTYDVRFTAPADLLVVAAGATVARRERDGALAEWRLVGAPMRDFNLVASKEYGVDSVVAGQVLLNSYSSEAERNGRLLALGWAAKGMGVFEEMFGPYPYRELDIVATSTSAGGIEYPGLIVIAADLYSDPRRREFFESAVVHEVAHQWWYNVVGNDQINEPWLDEALAQYATYLYYQETYGEGGAERFEESLQQRWSRTGYQAIPIGMPVGAYDETEYSSIVYGRGALFFRALGEALGEADLRILLQRYYSTFAWELASGDEFRSLAEAIAGRDLGDLWREWIYP